MYRIKIWAAVNSEVNTYILKQWKRPHKNLPVDHFVLVEIFSDIGFDLDRIIMDKIYNENTRC